MLASSIPAKFPVVWASSAGAGYIRAIPTTPPVQVGAASLQLGFPSITFTDVAAGGVFPFGADENGILNQITAWSQWQNAGASVTYDAAFSTAIGGYPSGAVLYAAAGNAWWLSTADNNTSDPDTGGANWQHITNGLTYAGNPNGFVAGIAPVNNFLSGSFLWDTTNKLLWLCTTTGNAAGAVWTQITSSAAYWTFWCGTSAGSANAQTVNTPTALQAFNTGTEIRWMAGYTNTGAITLAPGAFGTFGLRKPSVSGPIALTGGECVAGSILTATFDGTYLQLTSILALGTFRFPVPILIGYGLAPASPVQIADTPAAQFAKALAQSVFWSMPVLDTLDTTKALKLRIHYTGDMTSNNYFLQLGYQIMASGAVTPASYVNVTEAVSAPGTASNLKNYLTTTLAVPASSLAAQNWVNFVLTRLVANAGDTNTGNLQIINITMEQ
jgi:hypothetical protein